MDEEIRELLAYPDEIGRQVGFKDLTKLHREWMLNMIRGEGDYTTTADGYVIVNKLRTTNGTVTLEVPQNSVGDDFLRRWARWARSTASPNRIALGTLTIFDAVAGYSVVCTGVSLQKVPDRTFDRTGTNLTYTLLATTITEQ